MVYNVLFSYLLDLLPCACLCNTVTTFIYFLFNIKWYTKYKHTLRKE